METRLLASLMRSTKLSTASLLPSTMLVGAATCFLGYTGGLAAGLVLDPCLDLVSCCWRMLKDLVPGLFIPPLPNVIKKSSIHLPCS